MDDLDQYIASLTDEERSQIEQAGHACEWCGADVADEYDHLCRACEQEWEAEQRQEPRRENH